MDKISKLKHTLYEVKMKIIHLEDRKAKNGLNKKEQTELDILFTTKEKLLGRIEKNK